MYLAQIKEAVETITSAISRLLSVDVMIVDSDMNSVGKTFNYPDEPNPVRRMSMIGKVISSGEMMMIDDKTNYYVCKDCPDINECEITGFIGVPIFFHDEVVGAIALIIPNRNSSVLYKNFRNSKEFLEKMADLLSSKIQTIYDYNNLNVINKERQILMDSMEDAIFSINELGYITYYNKKFIDYFNVKSDLTGSNLTDFIDHPVMKECFEKRASISNKLIYAECQGKSFYGFLSATGITIGGYFKGMLFIFKSLNRVNHALNNLTNKAGATFSKFSDTNCDKLKHALTDAKKIAISDQIILIQGEENCGEELLAQSIHNFSNRSENGLLKVDCNYRPVRLLEREIFGFENAPDMSERMGKILLSHKGTMYFHKINELPLYMQKRLTTFIKTNSISNNVDVSIDTRMIFFSSVQLADLVETGEFDEELFYWIGSNVLNLPPMRERKADLPILIKRSLEYFAKQLNLPTPTLDSELLSMLYNYDWPENQKEIEQVTEKIVINAKGEKVTIDDVAYLSLYLEKREIKSMDTMEREHIAAMLSSQKSKEEIARLLNISRGTLYRKIKKYNLI